MMMPLSEIYAMSKSDGSLGDRFAAPWGVQPGHCRFVRSSDNHVFRIVGDGGGYVRAVPDQHRPRARVQAVAELMTRLHAAGCGVVALIPSKRGAVVESVGDYHVTMVDAAPGQQIGEAELTRARAAAWGAALARIHEQGVTHGDFELDNLAWLGDEPTAFDFDGADTLTEHDDIACAIRELPAAMADAWLAGYRAVRALPDGVRFRLSPVYWRTRRASLSAALDLPEAPDDPQWLRDLRRKLEKAIDDCGEGGSGPLAARE